LEEGTDLSSEYIISIIIIIIVTAYDTVRHKRDSPRFDHTVSVHMKCLYSRRYFTGY